MIVKNIIAMLQLDDFYDETYNIQIAKGIYSRPKTPSEAWKVEKRRRILKKKVRKLEKKLNNGSK